MNEQLNEQIEQKSQEKKPLTKKICVQAFRKESQETWPGVWVAYVVGIAATVLVAWLCFHWPIWPLNVLGVIWLVLSWYLYVGYIFSFMMILCGVCTVSKDASCGVKTRYTDHGTELHYFRFLHHGAFLVSDWMYENVPVGEFFYIVSVPGAVRKPIAIYRISEYEWVGNPDEVKDYTHLYAAQGQAEERVENTILARRPLTKGRKWRLTDEEIARDLLENRVITGERVAGVFVAVAAMGGLLFLANTTAAVITLAGGGAAAVALLAYYLWYGRQIKGRHFVVVTDTLMDKDPIKRGFGKSKRTRYVLGFRKHRPYTLPVADESVYHDAELGDTFFVVRMEGKSKKIRAVYNALDVEVENDDE